MIGYLLLDTVARWLPLRGGGGGAMVVYSVGHMGDLLHTVPLIRCLRGAFPGRRVVWMVGKWGEALARRYRHYVDEVCIFSPDVDHLRRGVGGRGQGKWRQWQILRRLRGIGVDALISTLPADPVTRFVANAVRPKRWVFVEDRCPPRVHPGISIFFHPWEKTRYEADALLDLLKPLGVEREAGDDWLEYTVTGEEGREADIFLLKEGFLGERPLVLISPGSGWAGKNWPAEYFLQTAAWLEGEKGVQVAWVGSGGERAAFSGHKLPGYDWMGRTGLSLLAALLKRAIFWIGNDSGPMHLAAAVGCSTLSLWGPTEPGKWAPRGGGAHRHLRKRERCAGCVYWDWRRKCMRPGHDCMRAITVGEVQAACEGLLVSRGGG